MQFEKLVTEHSFFCRHVMQGTSVVDACPCQRGVPDARLTLVVAEVYRTAATVLQKIELLPSLLLADLATDRIVSHRCAAFFEAIMAARQGTVPASVYEGDVLYRALDLSPVSVAAIRGALNASSSSLYDAEVPVTTLSALLSAHSLLENLVNAHSQRLTRSGNGRSVAELEQFVLQPLRKAALQAGERILKSLFEVRADDASFADLLERYRNEDRDIVHQFGFRDAHRAPFDAAIFLRVGLDFVALSAMLLRHGETDDRFQVVAGAIEQLLVFQNDPVQQLRLFSVMRKPSSINSEWQIVWRRSREHDRLSLDAVVKRLAVVDDIDHVRVSAARQMLLSDRGRSRADTCSQTALTLLFNSILANPEQQFSSFSQTGNNSTTRCASIIPAHERGITKCSGGSFETAASSLALLSDYASRNQLNHADTPAACPSVVATLERPEQLSSTILDIVERSWHDYASGAHATGDAGLSALMLMSTLEFDQQEGGLAWLPSDVKTPLQRYAFYGRTMPWRCGANRAQRPAGSTHESVFQAAACRRGSGSTWVLSHGFPIEVPLQRAR
jgi:hypothetical protein